MHLIHRKRRSPRLLRRCNCRIRSRKTRVRRLDRPLPLRNRKRSKREAGWDRLRGTLTAQEREADQEEVCRRGWEAIRAGNNRTFVRARRRPLRSSEAITFLPAVRAGWRRLRKLLRPPLLRNVPRPRVRRGLGAAPACRTSRIEGNRPVQDREADVARCRRLLHKSLHRRRAAAM